MPAATGSGRARNSQLDPAPVVAKRNWALIIIVLLFDLGLAGAGVYLLTEGLSSGDSVKPDDPAPGSAAKTGGAEAPKPAPRADATPPAPPTKPIETTPVAAPTNTAETPSPAPTPPPANNTTTPQSSPAPTPTQTRAVIKPQPKRAPEDPYRDPAPPTGPVVGPPPPPKER